MHIAPESGHVVAAESFLRYNVIKFNAIKFSAITHNERSVSHMWAFAILAALVLLAVLLCLIYLSFRTARFPFIQTVSGGRKKIAVLFALAIYAVVSSLLYLRLNPVNAVICIVHLGGFWLLSELVFLIIRKTTGRFPESSAKSQAKGPGIWLPGTCAIIFTIIYMTIAWYLCTHVWEKDYTFESERLKGDLRIVQITDSHVGATFDAQGFHDHILRINEVHPDIVVVTGDFVDDDTTRDDMIGSCEALGDLKTKYGVFFSYGNHDKGYFNDEAKGWNNQDLCENLEKNGVRILQDESVLIDGRFYVVGRQDKSEEMRGGSRMTPAQLMDGLDPGLYKIVMDHQPLEYDEEAAAGADLVLSGHTHGGQFFPFNQIGVLTRSYERSYGHERREHTDFIVSSGIADWSLIFKTGCKSEFVVVDVHGT
jgi:predicted MPP superfamily phosphohydrolase